MQIQNNTSPAFSAGLTKQMLTQIRHSNPQKISSEFSRYGILTDFKNNKTIAWCALKSLQLALKLKKGLPNGIFVENFEKLNSTEKNSYGFCNILPSKMHKDKDIITQEKTIFFNSGVNWEKIDSISDKLYDEKNTATDSFLEIFLHEFAHAMHETNLLKRLNVTEFLNLITKYQQSGNIEQFSKKYILILNEICSYAAQNPFEAVACDLSKRIIGNLDNDSLTLKENPLKNSPYKRFPFYERTELNQILRKFWQGS